MTTTRETADHAELAAIISDDELARVHGHANFGAITPREVVNDGVRKYAVGYHSGHTQLCILMEHGLITKPRPGSYDANLTKKGKKYARVLYRSQSALLSEIAALRGEVDVLEVEKIGLRAAIFGSHDYDPSLRHGNFIEMARQTEEARKGALSRATQAERQRDELREALVQADLTIRSMPGTDQSDVEFIRQALANQGAA